MLNFFVTHGSDGNDVCFDDDQQVRANKMCLHVFIRMLEGGELVECTFEDGLKEVIEYRNDTHNDNSQFDVELEKFKNAFKDKVGTFYVWGVEYDCDLMFVEEGEQLPSASQLEREINEE